MIGCRPLTDIEVVSITNLLGPRDKAMFLLMVLSGFRIAEVLSLKIADVSGSRVTVVRRHMKGRTSSRTVLLHPEAKAVINQYLVSRPNALSVEPLFLSRKGGAIGRIQAWRGIKQAMRTLGLDGTVALHSARKTFADKMYTALGKDLHKTSKALGHSNIMSTSSYLSFRTEEIDEAILNIKVLK